MNIFKNKTERDHSFKWDIGTLMKPGSVTSWDKWGYVIVIRHLEQSTQDPTKSAYIFYSQTAQCEWEVPCWVANKFFDFVSYGK